jgi:WD40 repeat protein
MAAAPPPAARAAMFARLSASRPPRQAIGAFAGGVLDTTVFSSCQGTLLSFFTTRTVLPLRAACKEANAAIARRGWEDVDTAILGSLTAWAACFPAARAGNAGGRLREDAPPIAPEEWASLRALREPASGAPSLRELLLLGAGEGLAAAARDALPGVRIAAALTCGDPVTLFKSGASEMALAVLDTGLLVSGGLDSATLRLWNAATGESAGSIEGGQGGQIAALPGGRFAIVGYTDASASVWDAASRTRVCELNGHTGRVCCVAALPGGLVATASHDSTVRLWTAATGAHVGNLERGRDVWSLAMLPDGRLAGGCDSGTRLWDLSTRTCTAMWRMEDSPVRSLAVLEGGHLASGCSGGAMELWNTASGAHEATLRVNRNPVVSLVALPRGLLASGSLDGCLFVWSVAARACLKRLPGVVCLRLAALPDGRLARVSFNRGSDICVWELQVA